MAKTKVRNSTRARILSVFDNATEAREVLVKLTDDTRLNAKEFKDLRGKLGTIRNAIDVVLMNC
jgi:hypothetical protein